MSSNASARPLAVTIGDPAGIGPEVILDAWRARREQSLSPFCVIGGAQTLEAAQKGRQAEAVPICHVTNLNEAGERFDAALPVLDTPDGPLFSEYSPGVPSIAGAALAISSLDYATRLALDGELDGIVTAPIAKDPLARAGFAFPGQTEYLAARADMEPEDVAMMLAGPSLRAVPITIHIPLSEVPQRLTSAMIERRARIAAIGLIRDFGIPKPRLAVAALNPHAGEAGRMGDEEERIIAPAIAVLAEEGLTVTGPYPADALFAPHIRQTYDAAIAMYHDQALIPVKALDFDAGVNVTLGLPFIRTSPDHGTAFAIAGTGSANPGAMIAAIKMAAACADHRYG